MWQLFLKVQVHIEIPQLLYHVGQVRDREWHLTAYIHFVHQGLIQDYQLLVLQEGESDMFQYFNTIFYVRFRNSREGNQPLEWEIPVLPTL